MDEGVIVEDVAEVAEANLPWGLLEGKNILISGANGFLPAYMVETILHLNDELFSDKATVYALARSRERAAGRFKKHLKRDDLRLIIQDVCDKVKEDADFHYIIHAASQASPKYYGVDPVGTLSANVLGTSNLLDLAREKESEGFMFFSTSEVYGSLGDEFMPVKEDTYGATDPTNLASCYSESKRMGENMCVSWHRQHGVPAKIVRPFHTYGPGMRLDDGRVFADFVSNIVNSEDITVKGDGGARRAYCYLRDATTGFFTVLLKGDEASPYNVGNEGCEYSVLELAQKLVQTFPEKKLKVVKKSNAARDYLRSGFTRLSPDTSKLRGLGWKPKVSVEEGFKRTVRYYE